MKNNVEVSFDNIGIVRINTIPIEKIQPGQVVVKNKYTLISAGTEKANLLGYHNTNGIFPMNIGYSGVGEVVELSNSKKGLKEGDKVFVAYGGHKRYSTVSEKNVYLIPKEVPLESAVFTKIASYPLLGIRRTRMEMGETVAVVGLGNLGLLGIQLAKIGGARTVFAIGHRETHLKKALECGADYALCSEKDNIVDIIESKTEFLGSRGVDVVIDTSGNQDELLLALEYAGKRGRISITGCNRTIDKPIDIYKYIHKKGLMIVGGHENARMSNSSCPGNWSKEKDYMVIMEYMRKGLLRPQIIQSEIFSYKEAERVYGRLVDENDIFPTGVIFDWD